MVIRMRDPFAALLGLQRAMDGVTGNDWFGSRTSGSGAFPLVNVFNDGDDYVLVAELPGVKKDDIQVTIDTANQEPYKRSRLFLEDGGGTIGVTDDQYGCGDHWWRWGNLRRRSLSRLHRWDQGENQQQLVHPFFRSNSCMNCTSATIPSSGKAL